MILRVFTSYNYLLKLKVPLPFLLATLIFTFPASAAGSMFPSEAKEASFFGINHLSFILHKEMKAKKGLSFQL